MEIIEVDDRKWEPAFHILSDDASSFNVCPNGNNKNENGDKLHCLSIPSTLPLDISDPTDSSIKCRLFIACYQEIITLSVC